MSHYTVLSKHGNCSLLRIKKKAKNREELSIFVGDFNEIIIPLALVGYEMIIANEALRASLTLYHLISSAHS